LPIEWISGAGLILAVGAALVWIGSREGEAPAEPNHKRPVGG